VLQAGGLAGFGAIVFTLLGLIAGVVVLIVARRRKAVLICCALSILPMTCGAIGTMNIRSAVDDIERIETESGTPASPEMYGFMRNAGWIFAGVGGAGSGLLLGFALLAALVKRQERPPPEALPAD